MGNTAKEQSRTAAEKRRADANASGKKEGSKGPKNDPDQLVHGEEKVHTENTDRDMDDLYATDGENEVLEWRRYSDLEAPPPRKGYVNRFIRIRLGAVRDTARLRNAQREGWRPVKASTVNDRSLPTIHLDQYGEIIGVEDLILCEMPKKLHKQRMKHFREKRQRQNAAIERQLKGVSRVDQPGFGPIEATRHTSVTAAPQRKVEVADDD